MTRFDQQLGGVSFAAMVRQFGKSATWLVDKDNLASAVSLTVVAGLAARPKEREDRPGRIQETTNWIAFSLDPDSDYGGVADPRNNAVVTMDSETWSVRHVDVMGGGVAVAELVKIGVADRTRKGHFG